MKRRAPTEQTPAPPAHLLRFDRDDWPAEPEPPHWRDDAYPWPMFHRRLSWIRARNAWVADQPDPTTARHRLIEQHTFTSNDLAR